MKQETFNFWDRVITLTALGLAITCIWLMVMVSDLENYYGS